MESKKKDPMCINPWLNGMVMIPRWLLIRTEISPSAKLAIAIIADEMNDEGLYIEGVEGLSQMLAVDTRRGQSIVNELRKAELLQISDGGWVVVVPSSWTDTRFVLDPNGVAQYASHEPGQWWMERSPYVVLREDYQAGIGRDPDVDVDVS